MRIYASDHESELIIKALICLRSHYPHTYGFDAQKLLEKIAICCEKQENVSLDAFGVSLDGKTILSKTWRFE